MAPKWFPRFCVLFFLLFVFKMVGVEGDCTLSVKDFSKPSPVYVKHGTFLDANLKGKFIVKKTETLVIGCPGHGNSVAINKTSFGQDVVEARCLHNQTFKVEGRIAYFKDIICHKKPTYEEQRTNKTCYNYGHIYQVGYRLKNKFYSVYEACFDNDLLKTHYVKHLIRPSSKYIQAENRPNFIEGALFNKVKMSKLYKVDNQRKVLDQILGANMSDLYITKHQFLTRGHLAARADFTLSAEVRATFHYINAAPQWQRENAGDWRMLEDGLRRRIQELNRTITVFTGTHEVMTLNDAQNKSHEIYLYTDANNNGIVGVPKYFYKLAYDPSTKSATAFITVNSPYYKHQTDFCTDVCNEVPWLKWRDDGFYSTCCSFSEFVDIVRALPKLAVEELFV